MKILKNKYFLFTCITLLIWAFLSTGIHRQTPEKSASYGWPLAVYEVWVNVEEGYGNYVVGSFGEVLQNAVFSEKYFVINVGALIYFLMIGYHIIKRKKTG